ncbi:MAG: hypothetical protein ABFR19_06985 [Pseudomonadota bacterium]
MNRPLAVPVAWFLLGILLILSDFTLLTAIGYLLAAFAGFKLFIRGRMLACCLSNSRRENRQGKEPSLPCCLDEIIGVSGS